jgi:hypothetical protein
MEKTRRQTKTNALSISKFWSSERNKRIAGTGASKI